MKLAIPLIFAAVMAACGSDNDDPAAARDDRTGEETTTSATAETTTTLSERDREEQAVHEASLAAAEVRKQSAAPPNPDPDDPTVAETHTGLMLERWTGTLTALQHNRFAIQYPGTSQWQHEVESVQLDEVDGQDVAYAEICSVDDGERISAAGEVLAGGVRTYQVTEALRKENGVWKVAEVRENQRWEGVAGCAAD